MTFKKLKQLGQAAIPTGEADWGSERQVAAETLFYDSLQKVISNDAFEKFETFGLKATCEESFAHAIEIAAAAFTKKEATQDA